jgi:putative MATE family efflux protein
VISCLVTFRLMGRPATPVPSDLNQALEHPSLTVWALAWPAVALNSLQVINTLLDRFFIGHLPQSALTALGGAMSVTFLTFSIAMALATGATAIVARAFGAGDQAEYREASRQVFGLAWMAGIICGGLTIAVAPLISRLMLPATDVAAVRQMTGFVIAFGLGLPAIFIIQTLAGSLRGIGDTKSPMVISGTQILLHITLNYLLIAPTRDLGWITIPGAGMGVVGAATALSISAWVSAIIYSFYCGRTPLGQAAAFHIPASDWVKRILKIAVPAATMAVLRVLSLAVFSYMLTHVPNSSLAIAVLPVAFGIESIMFMPSFGLSMAASALVGQSLGMKDTNRAERLGWIAAHHGALVTLGLSIPIFIFAPQISAFLLKDKPELVSEVVIFLRLLCSTEMLFAYGMVIVGAMQGAGDTVRPLWISIVSLWGLRVPIAYILAFPFHLGSLGAWIAMAATQAVQGILCLIAFKQGGWKTKKV